MGSSDRSAMDRLPLKCRARTRQSSSAKRFHCSSTSQLFSVPPYYSSSICGLAAQISNGLAELDCPGLLALARRLFVPAGTVDNSPPLQRWDQRSEASAVPSGTTDRSEIGRRMWPGVQSRLGNRNLFRPYRDCAAWTDAPPTAEAVGSCDGKHVESAG